MQHFGGVLKITVVHQHAKASNNTSSFTNSITYNFHFVSIIYCVFSNKQPGHLFQSWSSKWAAYSRAHFIKGVAYSTIEKIYNEVFKKQKEKLIKTKQNAKT